MLPLPKGCMRGCGGCLAGLADASRLTGADPAFTSDLPLAAERLCQPGGSQPGGPVGLLPPPPLLRCAAAGCLWTALESRADARLACAGPLPLLLLPWEWSWSQALLLLLPALRGALLLDCWPGAPLEALEVAGLAAASGGSCCAVGLCGSPWPQDTDATVAVSSMAATCAASSACSQLQACRWARLHRSAGAAPWPISGPMSCAQHKQQAGTRFTPPLWLSRLTAALAGVAALM